MRNDIELQRKQLIYLLYRYLRVF